MQKLLKEIGLESQRIQMINISSAMGGQFAWSAAEMTAEIKRIGANPLRQNGIEEKLTQQTSPAEVNLGSEGL